MNKFNIRDLLCSKLFAFIFSLILFLSTCYLDKIPHNYVIDYLSVVLSITIIIFYVINFKFSKISTYLMLFFLAMIFSTLISNTASFEVLIKTFIKVLAFAFYVDWVLKYNTRNVIKGIYYSLYILVFINFITILLYPKGMYSGSYKFNWFLGYDNTHIFWYIPALVLSLINLRLNRKRISIGCIILFLITAYSVYYCFSANSVVAYTLFLVYLLTKKYTDKWEWMNSKTYFIVFIIFFILFIILRVQDIFSWLIVGILNKDLTFTGRTIVWDNTISFIKNNWLFGYGMEDALVISRKLGNAHYVHAHNTLLDVLYKGGIIAFIPFIMYLYVSIEQLFKKKNEDIARIFAFAVFSVLIMMLFEARETVFGFYILFTVAYNIEYICKECNNEEGKNI